MKIHPVGAELYHVDRQTVRHDEVKRKRLANQSVNAGQRNARCVFHDPHKKHEHTVCTGSRIFYVKFGGWDEGQGALKG